MIYLEIWFRLIIINLAQDTFIIFNPLVKIDSISTTDDIQSLTRKSVTRINHKGNISMKNNKVVDKKIIQKYKNLQFFIFQTTWCYMFCRCISCDSWNWSANITRHINKNQTNSRQIRLDTINMKYCLVESHVKLWFPKLFAKLDIVLRSFIFLTLSVPRFN